MDRDPVAERSISGKPRDRNPEAKGPGAKASRFGSQGIRIWEAMGSESGKPWDRNPVSQEIGIL